MRTISILLLLLAFVIAAAKAQTNPKFLKRHNLAGIVAKRTALMSTQEFAAFAKSIDSLRGVGYSCVNLHEIRPNKNYPNHVQLIFSKK